MTRYTADTYWPAIAARANGTPLGRPDVVAIPRTEEGVAVALRVAAAHGVPVVAWGGGSGTQGGAVPIHGGLVIDLRGLDRIVEIDERSLTVTAQAGVNGRELERVLNARGLMLPHYPASAEWATVGGYVAARGSGVLSTRYGKIEDLVLSLRVALAGGELIDTVVGPAPRRRARPDAALRRLRGHARDHHARDARGRPAAERAPVRDARRSGASTPASRPSARRSPPATGRR